MTDLRESLQMSLAYAVQRAQAASGGARSGVSLTTLTRPVPGGKSAVLLVVTVPEEPQPYLSGIYNVRTCAKADAPSVQAEVLAAATQFVHSVGGVALTEEG